MANGQMKQNYASYTRDLEHPHRGVKFKRSIPVVVSGCLRIMNGRQFVTAGKLSFLVNRPVDFADKSTAKHEENFNRNRL